MRFRLRRRPRKIALWTARPPPRHPACTRSSWPPPSAPTRHVSVCFFRSKGPFGEWGARSPGCIPPPGCSVGVIRKLEIYCFFLLAFRVELRSGVFQRHGCVHPLKIQGKMQGKIQGKMHFQLGFLRKTKGKPKKTVPT